MGRILHRFEQCLYRRRRLRTGYAQGVEVQAHFVEECVSCSRVVVPTLAVLPPAAVVRTLEGIQQPAMGRESFLSHSGRHATHQVVRTEPEPEPEPKPKPASAPVAVHLRVVVSLAAAQRHKLLGELGLHFCTVDLRPDHSDTAGEGLLCV